MERKDSRERLLAAAAEEFSSRGYFGAGVDRIAAGAAVNKRMIYHHFGDKAGLLDAVLDDRLGRWSGGAIDGSDARLLIAEAERLRDGGTLAGGEDRAAELAQRFAGRHDGAVLAELGVRLLPHLLPQLGQLLALDPISDGLAEQVRDALSRAAEKRRVTLKAGVKPPGS